MVLYGSNSQSVQGKRGGTSPSFHTLVGLPAVGTFIGSWYQVPRGAMGLRTPGEHIACHAHKVGAGCMQVSRVSPTGARPIRLVRETWQVDLFWHASDGALTALERSHVDSPRLSARQSTLQSVDFGSQSAAHAIVARMHAQSTGCAPALPAAPPPGRCVNSASGQCSKRERCCQRRRRRAGLLRLNLYLPVTGWPRLPAAAALGRGRPWHMATKPEDSDTSPGTW